MAKNYIDFEKLEMLSEHDKVVPLANKIIKLGEESGEVAQAYLAFCGSKNVSKSASQDDLLEECCDVINVVIDIINNLSVTDEEVKAMFDKKLNKWGSKINKY